MLLTKQQQKVFFIQEKKHRKQFFLLPRSSDSSDINVLVLLSACITEGFDFLLSSDSNLNTYKLDLIS